MNADNTNISSLKNKNILLGVTGSIAAYKSADLIRRLREKGATVRVAMTENAKRFISPLTMQALSGFPIHDDLFDANAEAAMGHIELARWADLILIAPATADFMARLLHGSANDLLTTVCLAAKAEIAIAPAMNQSMWKNSITQQNLQRLIDNKIYICEPGTGSQACGDLGPGRMMEPAEILDAVAKIFQRNDLDNLRVLITAGPTHEHIDPVRYISNASSGKMGYALAQAAHEAGAEVTVISGPVAIDLASNIRLKHVVSAKDMHAEVMREVANCDIFISVAAVSDYAAVKVSTQKIHKIAEDLQLNLKRNPDIVTDVAKLSKKPFVVGFAAETNDILGHAKEKKQRKNMDMIIVNDVSRGQAIGKDENEVTVLWNSHETFFPLMPKQKLAKALIKLIAETYRKKLEHSHA